MPTPLSAVQICNLALARIQVLQQISSLNPPDNTPAGLACATVYDFCRQECLHDFPWGWASKYVALTLVATNPNREWTYAYQYPTDCLFIRRLTVTPTAVTGQPYNQQPPTTYDRSDTNPQPAPFEIGYIDGAQCIYTDLVNASCKYTFDQTDTAPFIPEFVNLLSWRIAYELCMSLGASQEVKAQAARGWESSKFECAAHAMNESQNSQPFVTYNSETVRARW